MKPLLALNIGNTHTTLATVRGVRALRAIRRPSRECGPRIRAELLREALGGEAPEGAVIGSTVPDLVAGWRRTLERTGIESPLVVTPDLDPGLPMDRYAGRATLGADRLADLCGGAARYGAPLIIVDAGTAVTFNVIERDRGFIGGWILPGPALMIGALAAGTAQLPRLSPEVLGGRRRVIGRATDEAIRAGVAQGFSDMVLGLVRRLRMDLGGSPAPVVLTGGGVRWIRPVPEPPVRRDPSLTLFGLARLYRLNP